MGRTAFTAPAQLYTRNGELAPRGMEQWNKKHPTRNRGTTLQPFSPGIPVWLSLQRALPYLVTLIGDSLASTGNEARHGNGRKREKKKKKKKPHTSSTTLLVVYYRQVPVSVSLADAAND